MNESEPERLREIKAHKYAIMSLSFSNHSLSFLTGTSQDGFMNVWSIDGSTWVPIKIRL